MASKARGEESPVESVTTVSPPESDSLFDDPHFLNWFLTDAPMDGGKVVVERSSPVPSRVVERRLPTSENGEAFRRNKDLSGWSYTYAGNPYCLTCNRAVGKYPEGCNERNHWLWYFRQSVVRKFSEFLREDSTFISAIRAGFLQSGIGWTSLRDGTIVCRACGGFISDEPRKGCAERTHLIFYGWAKSRDIGADVNKLLSEIPVVGGISKEEIYKRTKAQWKLHAPDGKVIHVNMARDFLIGSNPPTYLHLVVEQDPEHGMGVIYEVRKNNVRKYPQYVSTLPFMQAVKLFFSKDMEKGDVSYLMSKLSVKSRRFFKSQLLSD